MGQAYFKCENSGYETNADLNAIRNIANPKKLLKSMKRKRFFELHLF